MLSVGWHQSPCQVPLVVDEESCRWKTLFLWVEILVLMDHSLLADGSVSNSLCLGWEGSATTFLLTSESWSATGPGAMSDCSQSLSLQNDKLQTALVLDSGSSIPDCDGEGEDGLSVGGVDVLQAGNKINLKLHYSVRGEGSEED